MIFFLEVNKAVHEKLLKKKINHDLSSVRVGIQQVLE